MTILYTVGCPKCKVLEAKLIAKGIEYSTVTDTESMLAKGLNLMPVLEVDGQLLDFSQAIQWVNEQQGEQP